MRNKNVLHLAYKGKLFFNDPNYNGMAFKSFQENLNDYGLKDLAAYQREEGIFQTLKKKNVKSLETYWSLVEPKHPALTVLAKNLMRIPSSTASIERLFFQCSFVHNNLRNRLTTERSKKLVHFYYALELSDTNVSDYY